VVTDGPTYHQDVAPMLVEHCGSCHYEGGIGPFSVYDYESAKSWAPAMDLAIDDGSMPPWFAETTPECQPRIPFADDPRLADADKQLFDDWIAAGTPEGDPNAAAQIPDVAVEDIVDPDAQVQAPGPHAVEGDRDEYTCIRMEVPNEGDVWITDLQFIPDNELVVHHALIWSDREDMSAGMVGPDGSYDCSGFPEVFPTELMGAWTPGAPPITVPANSGIPFKAGSSIVVNIHYHPTGTTTELDQSTIKLKWTDQQPDNHIMWYLADLPFGAFSRPDPSGDDEFMIPADAEDHLETVALWIPPILPWDMPVYAVAPHMHYLGSEMLVTIEHRDEPDECLVHTPEYRFDWQRGYAYDTTDIDQLPTIHPGDTVVVHCKYNNSMTNPFIDDWMAAAGESQPSDVGWGEETGDEMCMAMLGLVMPPVDLWGFLDPFL
jgi:hypothetical protein